ncbi:MAG TPA: hypothetical protein DCW90_02875 [Lachnospiraceae bacterium]|nr:hypothetical protein [uncultured Lachnoclostridium sp.]HAU84474.1 hypothetical protein [Lachnospiraceae bacterium]
MAEGIHLEIAKNFSSYNDSFMNLGYNELGLTSTKATKYSISKYGDPTNGFTNPVLKMCGVHLTQHQVQQLLYSSLSNQTTPINKHRESRSIFIRNTPATSLFFIYIADL